MKLKVTLERDLGLIRAWRNTYRGPALTQVHGWIVRMGTERYGPFTDKDTAKKAAWLLRRDIDIESLKASEIRETWLYVTNGKELKR